MQVDLVISERFAVGESPTWDPRTETLFWCDIPQGMIHAWHPASGARRRWSLGGPVASLGLARDGLLVVAMSRSVVIFSPQTGICSTLAEIDLPAQVSRLNDGKVGPDGAFYVGSMDRSPDPMASLYRVDADGGVTELTSGFSTSNGLAWTVDGKTLFHSDSQGDMFLDRWDFALETGRITNRRRLREHDLANGRADGGAFDTENVYWSAAPSCSRINRIDLDGNLLDPIALPLAKPTMPCFGGPDLRTVFVTSLDSGLDAQGHDGIASFRAPAAGTMPDVFGARRN